MNSGGANGHPLTVNHDSKGGATGRPLTVNNNNDNQPDDLDEVDITTAEDSAASAAPNDRLRPENIGRVKRLISELLSKRSVGTRPPGRFQATLDYIASALHDAPFNFHDLRWVTPLLERREGMPHGASTQPYWRDWRRWFPAQPKLWRFIRDGHSDPKIDYGFDYQSISVSRDQGVAGYSTAESKFMQQYFLVLQKMGVARLTDPTRRLVPGRPTCYLRLAFVPKEDGTQRMIVDGKAASLNEDPPSYRCLRVKELKDWMRPRTRLLRVDLIKYYWQFAASASQIQLQRFWLPDGRSADLLDMMMGIKGSGYWGGRCFAGSWILAFQGMGIDLTGYMDEGILQEEDDVLNKVQQVFAITILEDNGLRCHISPEPASAACKSDLGRPLSVAKFIGCMVDPTLGRISPAPLRLANIREGASRLLRHMREGTAAPMTLLSTLLGRIRSCLQLHIQAGLLSLRLNHVLVAHCRTFGVTKRDLRRPILPQALLYISKELTYWAASNPIDEFELVNNTVPVHATVTGDASEYGVSVGATATPAGRSTDSSAPPGLGPASLLLVQSFLLQFKFSAKDQVSYHHNWKEAMVPVEAMRALHDFSYIEEGQPGQPIRILSLTDSMTVRAAIRNKKTRSVEIARLVSPLLSDLNRWNWLLMSEFLEKLLMDATIHDDGSRLTSGIWDCAVPMQTWQALIFDQLGHMPTHVVDLFAEPPTALSKFFVSRFPKAVSVDHPAPIWVDALAFSSPPWCSEGNPYLTPDTILYAYPPPRMLQSVFARIERDRTPSILVVMPLRSQRAMPNFERLLTATPTLTSVAVQDLVIPEGTNPTMTAAHGQRLDLIVGLSSGRSELRKEYQLQRYGEL